MLLICLLSLPLPALAQGLAQTYVIKKGDTLWGISDRFLKDPYYWPSMWSHNPGIGNPHFIYPGQTVAIYDGRIEIVPATAETVPPVENIAAPAVASAPVPAPAVVPAATVKSLRGREGYVSSDALVSYGTLVDTVDNRIMIATGDTVFLEMKNLSAVTPGELYSLYESGEIVLHPVTGAPVGHRVSHLGVVRIVSRNASVATGTIAEAFREIRRGAVLQPYHPALREITLKRAGKNLSGVLMAAGEDKSALGQYDVIYLDFGRNAGLEAGNLLTISRPRTASQLAAVDTKGLHLPDSLLGSAVVLETQARTAAALVLKAVGPLYRGDRVTTVTE
jgi:hypothetical protein